MGFNCHLSQVTVAKSVKWGISERIAICQHIWTSVRSQLWRRKSNRLAENGADVRRNVQQNVMHCDMYSRCVKDWSHEDN
jgi:hypothetical protein